MKFLQVHKRSLFPSKAILDRKITLNPERLPKLKLKFDAQFKSYRPNPKKSYFQGSSFQNFWFPIPPDPPPPPNSVRTIAPTSNFAAPSLF